MDGGHGATVGLALLAAIGLATFVSAVLTRRAQARGGVGRSATPAILARATAWRAVCLTAVACYLWLDPDLDFSRDVTLIPISRAVLVLLVAGQLGDLALISYLRCAARRR